MSSEQMGVQVGSQWRDLDKRMHGRIVTITRVDSGRAYYGKNGNGPSISIERLRRPFWEPAAQLAKGREMSYSPEQIVSHEAAAKALDSLDDYARMGTGVDAHGPRGMLERYIEQQKAAALRQQAARVDEVEAKARELYEAYRTEHPDARMYSWEQQPFEPTREHWREKARAALKAALSAQPAEHPAAPVGVPDGWKLVPVEATDDMLKAAYPLHWWDGPGQRLKQDYRTLLAAAPSAPQGEG
jgi:hypothetical protein